MRRTWKILRWSVTSWIILLSWKANLLAKIITFGSMPWSGQLCNFTNSSWWKVDLKRCNYTHLSYTSQSWPLMLKKVKLPECKLKKKTQHNYHEKLWLWIVHLFLFGDFFVVIFKKTSTMHLSLSNPAGNAISSTWPRGIKWFIVTWSKHDSFMNFNRPAHAS